ncbi:MAG: glycerol-3-phosphate 1-O-acyltransferase PlsY [Clostridia bacterium]|nr:glycerol-3-phosphate 1-O-acyltransferase PlsY [Clostridia bacterium]
MAFLKLVLLGYLLGSIPFGFIVGKIYKIDIRKYGSGNIGFTNVLRVLGFKRAIFVLLLDAAKGFLAAWYGYASGGEVLTVAGALAAMAGHTWPFVLKFKGGKSVATGCGIILFLSWKITIIALLIWLSIVFVTRYVSLGSIVATIFVPIAMIVTGKPIPYIIFSIIGASIVILKHSTNIKRLLDGTENKLGARVIVPKGRSK